MSQSVSDTAMVMGAGLGKRMRPLTSLRPKPLVQVAGKALIDHSLDRLEEAGVSRVIVNVHYMAEALEAHLANRASGQEILISDERDLLLETGGGMAKALPLIKADPFFCVNSDNVWLDGPITAFDMLAQHWDAARMDALLLLVPHARAFNAGQAGDFRMDAMGRISRRLPGRVAPFIYTGIQLVSHRLLRDGPQGAFSTNILWDRAIAEGRLYGVLHQGLWFDVGTPQAIAPTEEMLARV